jgi:hypothetical protein
MRQSKGEELSYSIILVQEASLSRVIKTESAGKDRTQLVRAIVLALRELMRQTETDLLTYDLAAFITLSLKEISNTIDLSVSAWEKRGYWVKADRFRMEWAWTDTMSRAIEQAMLSDDWASVARAAAQVAEKLGDIKVPVRHKLGTPWIGAWDKLRSGDGKLKLKTRTTDTQYR